MQMSALRKKRLNSHGHEVWHPRSTSTSGAGSGASQEEPEEVCIIDTILEEQADQLQMQDVLIEELSDCFEELQEVQDLNTVHG